MSPSRRWRLFPWAPRSERKAAVATAQATAKDAQLRAAKEGASSDYYLRLTQGDQFARVLAEQIMGTGGGSGVAPG